MISERKTQQVQDIVGPGRICDRCGIYKSLLDFDRFETKWAPKNVHRWCRSCREEHNQQYDKALVVFLQDLFLETKRACEDRSHLDYKNWGALGIEDRFYSVDEFIEHVIDELNMGQINECPVSLIYDVGHFEAGNIQFTTQIEIKMTECKTVVLGQTSAMKEKQDGS